MKLRLLRDWNGWPVGKVWDEFQIGAGNLLVMRGIAEKVLDENPSRDTANRITTDASGHQDTSKDRGLGKRVQQRSNKPD